jgi:lysophospholipase L1-like esterase
MSIQVPIYTNVSSIYNYDPRLLANFRLALAKVRDNAANCKILCLGDSITHGYGCSSYLTLGTSGSYPARLAYLINTYMAPAAVGLSIPPISSAHDTRWTNGWGTALGGFGFGNAANYSTATPTGALIYNPGTTWDRMDVYYLRTGSSGTLLVSANNTVVGTGTAAGAGNRIVAMTTYSASALATGTLSITGSGGNCYITGAEPYQSSTKQVLIGNAGCYGIQTSAAATSGALNQNWYALDALNAYQPNLTIICLGVNDANSSVSSSTYRSNMITIINAAKVWGDVILISFSPTSSGSGQQYVTYEAQYNDVLKNLAASTGCVFIDIYGRYSTIFQANYMFDNLHPNNYGYWDMAQSVFSVLSNV